MFTKVIQLPCITQDGIVLTLMGLRFNNFIPRFWDITKDFV